MIRAGFIAIALLAGVACGKYGPPVRTAVEPSAASPAVSAAPAGGDTEECQDPNAAVKAVGQTP